MKQKDNDDKNFDEPFWVFIYLMTLENNDIFLSREGKIVKEIVRQGGYCCTTSSIAKKIHMHKPITNELCKILEEKKYITITKKKGCNIIKFNEEIITSALKIPHNNLMGDNQDEH